MQPLFTRRGYRRSFTLVEMLAVVVIIAILAGLVTAGAVVARKRAAITMIQMELQQLDMALRSYKEKYGEYPPDNFADTNAVQRHLARAFPRYNSSTWATDFQTATGIPASSITPFGSLVFWLGGIRDADGQPSGFSANPQNPFAAPAAVSSRTEPFFEFDLKRLKFTAAQQGYWPPNAKGTLTTGAYVYFRAENGDYSTKAATDGSETAYPARNTEVSATAWANPKSFQVLSAGLDLRYDDPDTPLNTFPAFPAGTNYTDAHYDNQANFCQGTFEDEMP